MGERLRIHTGNFESDTMGERQNIFDGSAFQFEQDQPDQRPRFVVGLDLGKMKDYSALSVVEMYGRGPEALYHCRHLERFKLGTSYPTQVARVRELCRREPLASNPPRLAIDQTGVGSAVVDIFRQARIDAYLWPIVIHGGARAVFDAGTWRVPKRELVACVQILLQTGRLKIAADLPELSILTTELQNFQVSISDSGFDSYEARSGKHDDLVLSLAMALWLAGSPGADAWVAV